MSIRCVCENGHVLNVKESLAGSSGLCPTCRVRVNVPHLRKPAMSEDTILDIVGKQPPSTRVMPDHPDSAVATSQSGILAPGGMKKTCERCNKEISASSHICPYCHTYIANLRDF
jgi:hypothetical protein